MSESHKWGPLRATSDLHLSRRTAKWVFAALAEMSADAQVHPGPSVLVGDIFDQATSIHMPTWNRLRRLLANWPGQVYVIAGNHDQYDGWENCLEGLDGGSCRVISHPVWTRLGRMMPYTKPEEFKTTLESIKHPPMGESMLPLLWTHHGFRGAYRNAMSVDRDGVSCMDIPDGHYVITGHYHMPQIVGRIIYCGSPYETTFAEEGQAKGWLRWADPLADPIPVRVPFGDLGAPRHITIYWDPKAGPPEVPDMRPHDRPRVVTTATRQEALDHSQQLRDVGLDGVPIHAKPNAGGGRGVVDTRLGPRTAAERFVASVIGVDNTQPDPDKMEAYAEEHELWEG